MTDPTLDVKPMEPQATETESTATFGSGAIGLCRNCRHRLTFCGIPFSASIRCPKCSAINVYRESQQPTELGPD
jgi:hypothetical protein